MSNTVILKGKGMFTALMFTKLAEDLQDKATFTTKPLKFWQLDHRHEIRFQNLTFQELSALKTGILGLNLKLEIF